MLNDDGLTGWKLYPIEVYPRATPYIRNGPKLRHPASVGLTEATDFDARRLPDPLRTDEWCLLQAPVRSRHILYASRPSSPQENGQHERMHKDLKREAARPPAENLAKQQKRLNLFQQRYNHERPHDALDGDFPSERWQPSTKVYSGRLRKPEYPGYFEIRRVSACGTFRLHTGQYFLSNALKGEDIGLEEVGDDIWSIVYYNTILGRIDLQTGKITGNEKV